MTGDGNLENMYVVVSACRTPEKHSLGELYISIGIGRSREEASQLALVKWASINPETGERTN